MSSSETLDAKREAFRAQTAALLQLGYDRSLAVRRVAELAGWGGTILDVGTGKGSLAVALASHWGGQVVTVDVSHADSDIAQDVARRCGVLDRVRFVHANGAALPYAENFFCCALTMDVLHHLTDATPIVLEMSRVVKPGGLLVLADLDEMGLQLVARAHRKQGREHTASGVTVAAAAQVAQSIGFAIVQHGVVPMHDAVVLMKPAPRSATRPT